MSRLGTKRISRPERPPEERARSGRRLKRVSAGIMAGAVILLFFSFGFHPAFTVAAGSAGLAGAGTFIFGHYKSLKADME